MGPGVQKGATYEACEIFDLAPTIAHIKGKKKPAMAIGRILTEVFSADAKAPTTPQNIKRLNEVLIQAHNLPIEKKERLAKKGFMTIDNLGVWHTTSASDNFNTFTIQQETLLKSIK